MSWKHLIEVKTEPLSSLTAEALASVGEVRLRVGGRSMLPSMHPGDVLNVRPKSRESIVLGDIILYCRGERLITHRVTGRRGSAFIVKGDARAHHDAPVPALNVLGRVVSITRGGKTFEPSRRLSVADWLLARFVRRVPWGAVALMHWYVLVERGHLRRRARGAVPRRHTRMELSL